MSVGSSPPQTPPQLSPDGRWVWDGHQWQPVPVVVGDVAGVLPVFPVAQVAVAPAPAPAAAVAYSPPQYIAPAIEAPVVPLWREAPRQGISIYLFVAAALVVLVMAMMALNSMNIVRLPWQSDGVVQVRPTSAPTPLLTERTDYARADSFLTLSLAPAVAALNQTLPTVYQTCNGTMTISCRDGLTASDQQLKKLLVVIDRAEIPPCIATGIGKLRKDFAQMDEAAQLALKGYADNQSSVFSQNLNKFGTTGGALSADSKAVDQALKTQCSTQRTGP
jgi:hypothetical protein